MQITNKTVREIALEAPLTTRVFEEFKIDYCCGGRINFTEACQNAGVDPSIVERKLDTVMQSAAPSGALEQAGPAKLIEHIVQTHHVFTRSELSRLIPLMEKVVRKHGDTHPELFEIQEKFTLLNDELLPHMAKEEMVLFPYINELDHASAAGQNARPPHFGTVRNPVRMMMFEHDAAGELLRSIRGLSSDYAIPEGACPSFAALYAGLEDLEKDLHKHIHLENNVLFEQAIELERAQGATSEAGAVNASAKSGCSGLF